MRKLEVIRMVCVSSKKSISVDRKSLCILLACVKYPALEIV